jgi:hypothetical protein
MQLGRIVEREKTAFQATTIGELFHHCGDVPAGALHTSGSVQFGKQAN